VVVGCVVVVVVVVIAPVPILVFIRVLIILQVLTLECDGSSLLSYDALELRKLLLFR
jgi:hypothetical protein